MSRSWKHHPGAGSGEGGEARRFFKRYSNKIMRKTEDLPDGNWYRRNGYTYDIRDQNYRIWSRNDFSNELDYPGGYRRYMIFGNNGQVHRVPPHKWDRSFSVLLYENYKYIIK
jgi:hypothetical protein